MTIPTLSCRFKGTLTIKPYAIKSALPDVQRHFTASEVLEAKRIVNDSKAGVATTQAALEPFQSRIKALPPSVNIDFTPKNSKVGPEDAMISFKSGLVEGEAVYERVMREFDIEPPPRIRSAWFGIPLPSMNLDKLRGGETLEQYLERVVSRAEKLAAELEAQ